MLSLGIMWHVFAITVTKHMALVPPKPTVRGMIVVFEGSPIPHVLRPTGEDDTFNLVGVAFVPGDHVWAAMDGERT